MVEENVWKWGGNYEKIKWLILITFAVQDMRNIGSKEKAEHIEMVFTWRV